MKQFIKFSGLCAAVLALVTFILQLATPAITNINLLITTGKVSGTTAIFGGDNITLSWAALIAWIFVLVSMLCLLAVSILPLVGVKALEKYENLLLLVNAGLLLVAGIFMFIVFPTFAAANGASGSSNGSVGAGWIIGGILAILGACAAGLKPLLGLVGKK